MKKIPDTAKKVFKGLLFDVHHYFFAKNCTKHKDLQLDAGEKFETKLLTLSELIDLRNKFGNRNISLRKLLEKAVNGLQEKQKLQELLFATH